MRVGIINDSGVSSSGIIYLNDIFLSGVEEENKLAQRVGLKIDINENISLSGEYKKLEDGFQTIREVSPFEESEITRMKINLCPVEFFPFSYEWEKNLFSDKEVFSRNYRVEYSSPSFPQARIEKKQERKKKGTEKEQYYCCYSDI